MGKGPTKKTKHQIEDHSSDKKYFTMIPRIVWLKCRSSFDIALWYAISQVAGDGGECFLSTAKLSRLAMMSPRKVQECRQYLLSAGLLQGELKNSVGEQIWHIRIPNLWAENIKWCENNPKIDDKIKARELFRGALPPAPHAPPPCTTCGGPQQEMPIKKNHKEKPVKNNKDKDFPVEKKRRKNHKYPAVEIYKRIYLRYPKLSTHKTIHRAIGEDFGNLLRWGRSVKLWRDSNWNPGNIEKMIKHSQKKLPPLQQQSSSRNTRSYVGYSAKDDVEIYKQRKGLK